VTVTFTTAAVSFPVTAVGSPALTRRVTVARSFAASAFGTAALARAIRYARAYATVAAGSAGFARQFTARRNPAVGAVGTAVLGPRTVATRKAVSATGTAGFARTLQARRSAAVSVTGTAGFARALIFGRVAATAAFGAPKARLDIPQDALNRISTAGTPDWPLNSPTKSIAGVTRNSVGAIVGGCTVYLVRQVDGVRIATATSNATTGAYSFTRGGDDPYGYRVVALLAGAPETHGITDLLVPA